jgi:hypothetical protein
MKLVALLGILLSHALRRAAAFDYLILEPDEDTVVRSPRGRHYRSSCSFFHSLTSRVGKRLLSRFSWCCKTSPLRSFRSRPSSSVNRTLHPSLWVDEKVLPYWFH